MLETDSIVVAMTSASTDAAAPSVARSSPRVISESEVSDGDELLNLFPMDSSSAKSRNGVAVEEIVVEDDGANIVQRISDSDGNF